MTQLYHLTNEPCDAPVQIDCHQRLTSATARCVGLGSRELQKIFTFW